MGASHTLLPDGGQRFHTGCSSRPAFAVGHRQEGRWHEMECAAAVVYWHESNQPRTGAAV